MAWNHKSQTPKKDSLGKRKKKKREGAADPEEESKKTWEVLTPW